MSLRDIEKFFNHLRITIQKIPKEHLIEIDMLIDLLYIYKKYPTLFEETHAYIKESSHIPLYNESSLAEFKNLFKEYELYQQHVKMIPLLKSMDGTSKFVKTVLEGHSQYFKANDQQDKIIIKSDDWYRSIEQLLTSTLYEYYQAIQFAGDFNKDDSKAGTT
jgi:hypothetical protein